MSNQIYRYQIKRTYWACDDKGSAAYPITTCEKLTRIINSTELKRSPRLRTIIAGIKKIKNNKKKLSGTDK